MRFHSRKARSISDDAVVILEYALLAFKCVKQIFVSKGTESGQVRQVPMFNVLVCQCSSSNVLAFRNSQDYLKGHYPRVVIFEHTVISKTSEEVIRNYVDGGFLDLFCSQALCLKSSDL